jgi:hypothetical protein
LDLVYLAILGIVAWLYFTGQLPNTIVPDRLAATPTGVIWFGALGGVLISLAGVHDHRYDWDDRYINWHLVRPAVGAGVAAVAVLIVQAGILAVGVSPEPTTAGPSKDILYYVIAFVTGYREETFRAMIKKVADVILKTEATPAPTIASIDPTSGRAGDEVTLIGTGLTGVEIVRFGDHPSPTIRVKSDLEVEATVPTIDPVPTDKVPVAVAGPKGSAAAPEPFQVLP